jgi:hypothetical protein
VSLNDFETLSVAITGVVHYDRGLHSTRDSFVIRLADLFLKNFAYNVFVSM